VSGVGRANHNDHHDREPKANLTDRDLRCRERLCATPRTSEHHQLLPVYAIDGRKAATYAAGAIPGACAQGSCASTGIGCTARLMRPGAQALPANLDLPYFSHKPHLMVMRGRKPVHPSHHGSRQTASRGVGTRKYVSSRPQATACPHPRTLQQGSAPPVMYAAQAMNRTNNTCHQNDALCDPRGFAKSRRARMATSRRARRVPLDQCWGASLARAAAKNGDQHLPAATGAARHAKIARSVARAAGACIFRWRLIR